MAVARSLFFGLVVLLERADAQDTASYVLKHLYEVTDGANWLNNENWLTGEPCTGGWATSSFYDCFSGVMF